MGSIPTITLIFVCFCWGRREIACVRNIRRGLANHLRDIYGKPSIGDRGAGGGDGTKHLRARTVQRRVLHFECEKIACCVYVPFAVIMELLCVCMEVLDRAVRLFCCPHTPAGVVLVKKKGVIAFSHGGPFAECDELWCGFRLATVRLL